MPADVGDEELDSRLAEFWQFCHSEKYRRDLSEGLKRGWRRQLSRVECRESLRLQPLLTLFVVLNIAPPQHCAAAIIHRAECDDCARYNTPLCTGLELEAVAAIANEFRANPSLLKYLAESIRASF